MAKHFQLNVKDSLPSVKNPFKFDNKGDVFEQCKQGFYRGEYGRRHSEVFKAVQQVEG